MNVQNFTADSSGEESILATKDSTFSGKYLINCAGQQSLDIAHMYNFGLRYLALPVKGNYLISNRKMSEIKTLVYPVPMKNTYFLGVHSTITPSGYVKIGPSATPAFSYENYKGLENIKFKQLMGIMTSYTRMLFSKQIGLISTLGLQELPKLRISNMVAA